MPDESLAVTVNSVRLSTLTAAVCPFTFSPVWNIATDLKESITCEVSISILPIVSGMWGVFQSTANPTPENLTNCVSPSNRRHTSLKSTNKPLFYRTKEAGITIFAFSLINLLSDEWGDIHVCKYIHLIILFYFLR